MIIYGHRSRLNVVLEGEFTCPHCQTRRPYLHKRLDRYLTLFFISTIRLGKLEEYVECQTCGNRYFVDILKPAPGQVEAPTGRPPKSFEKWAWIWAGMGVGGFLLASFLTLFLIVFQLMDSAGPTNNWQGNSRVVRTLPPAIGLGEFGAGGVGRNEGAEGEEGEGGGLEDYYARLT